MHSNNTVHGILTQMTDIDRSLQFSGNIKENITNCLLFHSPGIFEQENPQEVRDATKFLFQPLPPILFCYKQHSTTVQDGHVRNFNKVVENECLRINVHETSRNYMRFS